MRILIADDEKSIVDMLMKYLEGKSLLMDQALDGDKALSLIKEKDYDIIFLDMNMSGLTGLEITKYIKKNNIRAKVVILTGYLDLNEHFCKTFGADEYLEKPVDLKIIGEIIDKYKK